MSTTDRDISSLPKVPRYQRMTKLSNDSAVEVTPQHPHTSVPESADTDLRVFTSNRGKARSMTFDIGSRFRVHSPIPVIAVNDRPVAAGFGSVNVPVPVGTKAVVSVQTQDSKSNCCSSWPIDVKEDDDVPELEYAGRFITGSGDRRHYGSLHGVLGKRGIPSPGWKGPMTMAPSIPLVLSLVIMVLSVLLIMQLYGQGYVSGQVTGFVAVTVPLVVLGVGLTATTQKHHAIRDQWRGPLEEKMRTGTTQPPVLWNEGAPGARVWNASTSAPTSTYPQPSRGAGIVVLRQELSTESIPHPKIFLAKEPPNQTRRYEPAPQITVSGREPLSAWGHWVLEVPAGHCTVRADFGFESQEKRVTVTAGATRTLTVKARVVRRFKGSGPHAEHLEDQRTVEFSEGRLSSCCRESLAGPW